MKEVDGLLSEIAIMLGRWSLYSRFLAAKCKVSRRCLSETVASHYSGAARVYSA